jgi:hypothetical protein
MNNPDMNNPDQCSPINLLLDETQKRTITVLGNNIISPGFGELAVKFSDNIDKINKNIEGLKILKSQENVIDIIENKTLGGGQIKKYGGDGEEIDNNIEIISDTLQAQKIEIQNKIGRQIVDIDEKIKKARIEQAKTNNANMNNTDGKKLFGKDFFQVFDLPEVNKFSYEEKVAAVNIIPESLLVGLNPDDNFCDDDSLNKYIKNKIDKIISVGGVIAINVSVLPLIIVVLGYLATGQVLHATASIIGVILNSITLSFGMNIDYFEQLNGFIDNVDTSICNAVLFAESKINPLYPYSNIEHFREAHAPTTHKFKKIAPPSDNIREVNYGGPDTESQAGIEPPADAKPPKRSSIFSRLFGSSSKGGKTKKNKKIKRKTRKNKRI